MFAQAAVAAGAMSEVRRSRAPHLRATTPSRLQGRSSRRNRRGPQAGSAEVRRPYTARTSFRRRSKASSGWASSRGKPITARPDVDRIGVPSSIGCFADGHRQRFASAVDRLHSPRIRHTGPTAACRSAGKRFAVRQESGVLPECALAAAWPSRCIDGDSRQLLSRSTTRPKPCPSVSHAIRLALP